MAFITIPIWYIEGSMDDEDDDITRLKRKGKAPVREADMTINTQLICAYVGEDENRHTMVYMSDGNAYECTWDREKFTDLLAKTEAIVEFPEVTEN
jgi:hypothetical protein